MVMDKPSAIAHVQSVLTGTASVTTALVAEILGWSFVVIVVALFGWAVSSLHVLAGWTDDAPVVQKLEIIKGIFASIAASAVFVMVGHWQGWPMLLNVLGAFFAGMAGDRLLRPMADTVIQRAQAALDAIFGRATK